MRWKDLFFPRRKIPVLIRRIRAKAYPFIPSSRPYATSPAGGLLLEKLEQNRAGYELICREIVSDRDRLSGLSAREKGDDPNWINGFIPPLDGMSLYTLIRMLKPRTYLEIGSGNSTKFARKAIRDHGLSTRIVSVDPKPRAEIDALCDEIIRAPFQNVAGEVLGRLTPGDILFQDGSHRALTNTDTTVFFTEFLPMLPRGITYGIHDIFLPNDYPEIWHRRFYNEQYVLLAYLLGGAGGDEIVFPVAFVAGDQRLKASLGGIFDLPALSESRPGGAAFWMRRP
jgi:Methyltransferase domain